MLDKDFEMLAERRVLLTDAGYFDRWRVLAQQQDSRGAWNAVEIELHEAFGMRRFLTYQAFHQAMRRNIDTEKKTGKGRPSVRLYEVNTV